MEVRPTTDLNAVLANGRQLLNARDLDGYWKLMARHDPYAELAGDIAAGRGPFAVMARGHLQRNALKKKGRELDDREWQALAFAIADGDLNTRTVNVANKNDIRVTSIQTDDYHGPALRRAGLDANAFLPHTLQKVSGGFWSFYAGAPTQDVTGEEFWKAYREHKMNDLKGFMSDPVGYLKNLGEAARVIGRSVGDFSDALDAKFFDWLNELDREFRGPRPLRQNEGSSNTDPGASPRPSALDAIRLKEQNKIADFRSDLLLAGTPTQEALLKDPRLWTADEEARVADLFHDIYVPGNPEARAIDDLRGVHFKHNSPDHLPLGVYDDRVAKVVTPATAAGGLDLTQALASLGDKLAQDAEAHGLAPVVRGLQTGLKFIERDKGGVDDKPPLTFTEGGLRVDGQFGWKTRSATRRAVVALGPDAVARATGLGRFDDTLRRNAINPATLEAAANALFARPAPGHEGRGAARNLQEGFNSLGYETFKPNWTDIAVDGDIGPETEKAYQQINSLYGPGALARYMGEKFSII